MAQWKHSIATHTEECWAISYIGNNDYVFYNMHILYALLLFFVALCTYYVYYNAPSQVRLFILFKFATEGIVLCFFFTNCENLVSAGSDCWYISTWWLWQPRLLQSHSLRWCLANVNGHNCIHDKYKTDNTMKKMSPTITNSWHEPHKKKQTWKNGAQKHRKMCATHSSIFSTFLLLLF